MLLNSYAARKDFALKNNKITFDMVQINREGSKKSSEDVPLSETDFAGAYDAARVCDVIITINRNRFENGNKVYFFITKGREGGVGRYWAQTDFARARYLPEDTHDTK